MTLPLAFLAGVIIGNFRVSPELLSRTNFQALVGSEITISGTISEDPVVSEGQTKLRLQQLEIIPTSVEPVENLVENSENISTTANLSGTAYVQLGTTSTTLERSDRITIQGVVGQGFGVFVATFYRPKLISLERSDTGDIFARLKLWFAQRVRASIPSPPSELGLGYLVGMKAGLPDNFSEALSTVGMTHVVVASGAHLGILVGFIKKIFGKISKFASLLFSLLLILAFALVVGFTPSMTRATLVASLGLIVGYVGRKFTPLRLLSLVAALTLLLVPTNFLNLGWQLSFASFFGIMVFAPNFQKLFYGGKKLPWLAGMLITSLSTSLVCAPILIYNFGKFSVLSLVANLIILPTLPYCMLLVFLVGVFSSLPFIVKFLSVITTHLLEFHIFIINYLSQKKMFVFEFPSSFAPIFLLYLPLILLVFFFLWRTFRARRPP